MSNKNDRPPVKPPAAMCVCGHTSWEHDRKPFGWAGCGQCDCRKFIKGPMPTDLPTNQQIAEIMDWKRREKSMYAPWHTPGGKIVDSPFDFYTPDGMMLVLSLVNTWLFSRRRLFMQHLKEQISRNAGLEPPLQLAESELVLRLTPTFVILAAWKTIET